MSDVHESLGALLLLLGRLAVLAVGLRILLASWDAPAPGAMPLVITDSDRERRDGQLNVRQVLLALLGTGMVLWAAAKLMS